MNDSIAESVGLEETKGLRVNWVRPNTDAANAGIQPGDILFAINGEKLNSNEEFLTNEIVNGLREGDKVIFTFWNGEEEKEMKSKLNPKPRESYSNATVEYGRAAFRTGFLSTILVTPNTPGPHPVVYFLPGYNCASYDNLPAWHPYQRIIDSLVNLDYAVFRCEKTGMGDCQSTPNCFKADFETEQAAFEAGYDALENLKQVDSKNIFLFGHSLGGINAPLLAAKAKPRGIIVYGTSHIPWADYLDDMLRFQNPRMGVDSAENEKDMVVYEDLLREHYVEKQPLKKIAENPEYVRLLERDFQYEGGDMLFQRHFTYWQQIHHLGLEKVWSELDCKVLSVYGEADFEALNPSSHKEIVELVNENHPGNATYKFLPETNHGLIKVGSMEDGVKARNDGSLRKLYRTAFNYDFVTMMDEWMKSVME